jgi:uncharacterized protein (TIGR02300 family)
MSAGLLSREFRPVIPGAALEAKARRVRDFSRFLALTGRATAIKGTGLSDEIICTTRLDVAKPELGTKRIDPETGRKFYDLNKDPIVSPYTGVSYPRSYFDTGAVSASEEEEEVEQKELDAEDEAPEVVTLEEADEEAKGGGDDVPDVGDDEDVEIEDDDDDTFLAEEEEEDDDVSDIIGVGEDDDEV